MSDIFSKVDWDKGEGLVPAIVQDSATARVLMLGYMNHDALTETLRSGRVTFFSRSKGRLWTKGETSGHFLDLDGIAVDCDGDTLLIQARAKGPACHNGTETCFADDAGARLGFLGRLSEVIAHRAKDAPEESYVARLLARGTAKAAQKVGEEGVETALAAVLDSQEDFRNEAADLVFHLMVLLQAKGSSLAEIAGILEERHAARENKASKP